MQILPAIKVSVLLGATLLTQGFPWEIFKPRTLKEVIFITSKAVRPDDSMFLSDNQLESKVAVVFTGQSRPIIKERKDFIKMWVGTLRADQKGYDELYEREYLYKEGAAEYWLATSNPITQYFDKELKPGDKMDLYLISIGAYRSKNAVDCVLLVEEFQKPAAQQARATENIFTTDMAGFINVAGYRSSIDKKQFPTGTWLEVKGLASPGQLVESIWKRINLIDEASYSPAVRSRMKSR